MTGELVSAEGEHPAAGDELSVATPGEEWCPVAATVTTLRNRWVPGIVARLLERPHRFTELRDDLPGISGKVLTDTLDRLIDDGVVERRQAEVSHHPVVYALTERGRSLEPVVTAMREWGDAHAAPAEDPDATPLHV